MLLSSIFLIAWMTIPIGWYVLLKSAHLSLNNISIITVLLFFIVIFQYLGYPILFFSLDEYRAEYVTDKHTVLLAWLVTSVTTFEICLGAVLANIIFGKINLIRIENTKKIIDHKKLYFLLAFCAIILIIFVDRIGLTNLAIFVALNNGVSDNLLLSRSDMSNNFGAGYHWYRFITKDLLIICTLIAYFNLRIKKSRKNIFLLAVSLVLTIFSLIMTTEKGPLIDLLIGIFLISSAIDNNFKMLGKKVALTVLVGVTALTVSYMLFMGDSNIFAALYSVYSRTLTGSIQPLYHYLKFFPDNHDWLYGASFPNPRGLFPFENYNLTNEIINFVHPELVEKGIVGSMPTIYWGELYSNFGYTLVFIAPIAIGFYLYSLNLYVSNLKNKKYSLIILGWLAIHYKNLSVTSFSSFLFDFNVGAVLLIYMFLSYKIKLSMISGKLKS